MFEPLKKFLAGLPEGVELVLNGDTVDRRRKRLTPLEKEALRLLRDESFKRKVIWIWGNHDWKYIPPDPGKIEFVRNYNVEKRLFLSHGHKFDFIMMVTRPLIILIRMLHDLHVDLGGRHVHVAFAAKRFAVLYGFLRQHIAGNAARFAKVNGYGAVACGHTHYAEDLIIGGTRYINTGAWTEAPIYCLTVDHDSVKLMNIESVTFGERVL